MNSTISADRCREPTTCPSGFQYRSGMRISRPGVWFSGGTRGPSLYMHEILAERLRQGLATGYCAYTRTCVEERLP